MYSNDLPFGAPTRPQTQQGSRGHGSNRGRGATFTSLQGVGSRSTSVAAMANATSGSGPGASLQGRGRRRARDVGRTAYALNPVARGDRSPHSRLSAPPYSLSQPAFELAMARGSLPLDTSSKPGELPDPGVIYASRVRGASQGRDPKFERARGRIQPQTRRQNFSLPQPPQNSARLAIAHLPLQQPLPMVTRTMASNFHQTRNESRFAADMAAHNLALQQQSLHAHPYHPSNASSSGSTTPRASTPTMTFSNMLPSLRTGPLPPALSDALAARDRQLPSVLQPKPVQVPEISYADAIEFLTSTLESVSPSSVLDRVIDVALYDPKGTYLIPVRTTTVRSTTTLYSLILILQGLLDENVRDLGMLGTKDSSALPKFLISGIQLKVYLNRDFAACPTMRGELAGVTSADRLNAETVRWPCDGQMEKYWELYKKIVLLDTVPKGLDPIRRPMVKVYSVKKPSGHDHLLAGGGHLFVSVVPKVRFDLPTKEMEATITEAEAETNNKGKIVAHNADLSSEAQVLVNTIVTTLSASSDPETISQSEIQAAVSVAYSAIQEERKAADKDTNHWLYKIYDSAERRGASRTSKFRGGGYDKSRPIDPLRNWGYYQHAHGDPGFCDAFSLDHVPFEEEDLPHPGAFGKWDPRIKAMLAKNPKFRPMMRMVPWQNVPPSVFNPAPPVPAAPAPQPGPEPSPVQQLASTSLTDAQKQELERIDAGLGFNQSDDDEYIPYICNPPPPSRSPVSARPSPAMSSPVVPVATISATGELPDTPTPRNGPRLDVSNLLNSVLTRKNITDWTPYQSAISGQSGTPSSDQIITAIGSERPQINRAPIQSFNSFNSFTNASSSTTSASPGFYGSTSKTDTRPGTTTYESFLAANSSQTAGFYGNLKNTGSTTSPVKTSPVKTSPVKATPASRTASPQPGARSIAAPRGPSITHGTFRNAPPSRPGVSPTTSLSSFNAMINSKNPPSGPVTTVGARNFSAGSNIPNPPARFSSGKQAPTSTASLSSYLNTVNAARTRTPFQRPGTTLSQLRADSPAFQSVVTPPGGNPRTLPASPGSHPNNGLAERLNESMNLNIASPGSDITSPTKKGD